MVSQTSESSAPTTMSMLAAPANPWTWLLEVCAIGNACAASAPGPCVRPGSTPVQGVLSRSSTRESALLASPRVSNMCLGWY